jgi:DNA-binding NarL/FixJ family response regulator
MSSIRVLIADDHALVRAGMRVLLGQVPEVDVIAEASDGRETLHLIATHQPDVVLMDITMPGLNGLEATVRVAKEFPRVRVIILSMHAVEEYVLQALHAGASGYLLKHAAPVELGLAVKAVVRGETYLSPPISKVVIDKYLQRTRGEPDHSWATSMPYGQLTSRQREILQLIAEGHTTKDIAQCLNLSARTVETHRTELMQRLDIHDVAGLVRYAIRTGLVSPDS